MKILINSYVKVDENGDFRSGTVHFQSIVPNKEYIKFESALGVKVNLSKSGNPLCDSSIFHMHQHNGHAGTFTSRTVMEEYIKKVKANIIELVSEYNLDLEDSQSTEPQLEYPLTMENAELHPDTIIPQLPAGMVVVDMQAMAEMMGYEVIDEEDLFPDEEG